MENIFVFLNPVQAKLACYFLGFVWAEFNEYMHKLHWRASINITSNCAPITIAFWCFHLSAQYSKRNYDQLGRGRNIHENKLREKGNFYVQKKTVFTATCTFGGPFVFDKHIHKETTDYKIWNTGITLTIILLPAALKWEKRHCTNENDLTALSPMNYTRELLVCTGNWR